MGVDAVLVGETLMRAKDTRPRCVSSPPTRKPRASISCLLWSKTHRGLLGTVKRPASKMPSMQRCKKLFGHRSDRPSPAGSWSRWSGAIADQRRLDRHAQTASSSDSLAPAPPLTRTASDQGPKGLTVGEVYQRDVQAASSSSRSDRTQRSGQPFHLFRRSSSTRPPAPASWSPTTATSSPTPTSSRAPTADQGQVGDGKTLDAKLVGQDPSTDLALLKVDPRPSSRSPLGDSAACRSATRWSRSATRSGSTARSPPASSPRCSARSRAQRLLDRRRDPDRRRDQPRQLGRPAVRRAPAG